MRLFLTRARQSSKIVNKDYTAAPSALQSARCGLKKCTVSTRRVSSLVLVIATLAGGVAASAEPLRMQQAIDQGAREFQSISSRKNQARAAKSAASAARLAYLPDVTAAVQQTFGTVNGWFGPQLPIGLSAISSAGPTSPSQSWNSGFGANYLFASNWEFFTFGRVSSRIDLADAQARRADADVAQETFVHSVRVASAYLDLLVAQQLTRVAASNLERVQTVYDRVSARARSGLVPEVDAQVAAADMARARLDIIDARDREQRLATQLATFLNASDRNFLLEEEFLSHAPERFTTVAAVPENPQVRFQDARVVEAEQLASTIQRSVMPGFNLGAAYQIRASGFDSDYNPGNGNFTRSYWDGVSPDRSNYIVGVTLAWNIASLLKIKDQVAAQESTAAAFRDERNQVAMQLGNQLQLADDRIVNLREAMTEVPKQYEAASLAYKQRNTLYENGLTDLVDVQQALFALNRAEVDRSVVCINLWQALLQKAAASGDFELFLAQARSL